LIKLIMKIIRENVTRGVTELQNFDRDEDEPLLPSTSSLEFVPASTLKAETPQAITSFTIAVEAS
jgi:hypothetical protein